MERTEMIITGLAFAGLIAVLVCEHGKVNRDGFPMTDKDAATVPNSRLGASTVPSVGASDIGPEYLLSNLPRYRDRDDYAPTVGIFNVLC